MTPAEVGPALEAAGFVLLEGPTQIGTVGTFVKYERRVVKVVGIVATIFTVVYAQNAAGTVAYWLNSDPTLPAHDEQLRAYLTARVEDGTIEAFVIEELDPVLSSALVAVVIDDAGTLVQKRFLIDMDSGSLRYREVTTG